MFKRIFIRFFSLILTLAAVVSAGGAFAVSADTTEDFTLWKQADPRWNQQEAWPAEQYPEAPQRTMEDGGGQVTALAMLLKQYGIVPEEDFTPWQCRERLQRAGAFDEKGLLIWSSVENAFPEFHFENRVEYSHQKISGLMEYGYACILEMKGKDGKLRYTAVRSVDGYTVNIMDPGSEKTELTQADGAEIVYYFSIRPDPEIPEGIEYAMFPAPVMEVTQLAYESYSHVISNAIDIIPHGEVIAPFRCTVAFTDTSWGYVVLQSTGKVLFADGTVDYMTVSYVHSVDIWEMVRAQKEHRVICQGEPIYHAGGMGRGKLDAYREHVHVAAYRGHVSGVTDDGYYGCGDVYPYDAFFVNPDFTTGCHGRGEGYKSTDSIMHHKAPDDYRGRWKTADFPGCLPGQAPDPEKKPD